MRQLKPVYSSLFIVLFVCFEQIYGQGLPLQTYSLAAGGFVSTQADGLQMDWRLDLGLTALPLNLSNAYCFSAGIFQPSINRFEIEGQWRQFQPSIELKYASSGDAIWLFSKEPDLILFGYTILNLQGQILIRDAIKYRSGYAGRPIPIQALASGVYLLQVGYLPESMHFDNKNNYWIKHLKLIKR